MILNGAKFYNIQEPLVNMRAGYGQLERRGGLKYAIEEFKFLKKLKEIATSQFIKSVLLKSIYKGLNPFLPNYNHDSFPNYFHLKPVFDIV